jgi:hypothetical protein
VTRQLGRQPAEENLMFGHVKDPVVGTATLVSFTETGKASDSGVVVVAQLILRADDFEEPVEVTDTIPLSQWPIGHGTVWKVTFDREKPTHVRFPWDEVNAEEALADVDRRKEERGEDALDATIIKQGGRIR